VKDKKLKVNTRELELEGRKLPKTQDTIARNSEPCTTTNSC